MARAQTAKRRRELRRVRERRVAKRPPPPLDLGGLRVVCLKCGLEQPYESQWQRATNEDVTTCRGWLGLGCGGEVCETLEAYEERMAA